MLASLSRPTLDSHLTTADLLGQAKSAATSAYNTASTLATQAANQAATTAQQVANSDTAKNLSAQASQFATTVGTGAVNLAGQAHAQAHAVAPSIVPPPTGTAGEVDTRGDLSPTNEMDKAKLDKLFASRASANELQDKGILKGQYSLDPSLRLSELPYASN